MLGVCMCQGRERAGATQLRVWLVDLQPLAGVESVMVLTAAVNPQVSQQLVYALGELSLLYLYRCISSPLTVLPSPLFIIIA